MSTADHLLIAVALSTLSIVSDQASATPAAKPQAIAMMESPPQNRWDIVIWLQRQSETITPLMLERAPQLANHEFIWHYAEVEHQAWHGKQVIPGKTQGYVVAVPMVKRGTPWRAQRGHVIIGYRRKTAFSSAEDSELISVEVPHERSDQPVFAETIRLLVDDEGVVYY